MCVCVWHMIELKISFLNQFNRCFQSGTDKDMVSEQFRSFMSVDGLYNDFG